MSHSKIIIIALIAIFGFYSFYTAHPFYSSYFNAFVGGTKGVADNNIMTVTYWQPELVYTLDFVNSLPEGSSISVIGDFKPYEWYQKIGRLRKSIVFDRLLPDYQVLVLKQSYLFEHSPEPYRSQDPIDTVWELFSKMPPDPLVYNVTTKDGVDLVRIYDLRERKKNLLAENPDK